MIRILESGVIFVVIRHSHRTLKFMWFDLTSLRYDGKKISLSKDGVQIVVKRKLLKLKTLIHQNFTLTREF